MCKDRTMPCFMHIIYMLYAHQGYMLHDTCYMYMLPYAQERATLNASMKVIPVYNFRKKLDFYIYTPRNIAYSCIMYMCILCACTRKQYIQFAVYIGACIDIHTYIQYHIIVSGFLGNPLHRWFATRASPRIGQTTSAQG
jgi:hypothetical protein